jgi:hypothetical protein
VPWATAVLIVVPVLVARYPPMTDLPLYEGALSLLRHWNDPAFRPAQVYELNLGRTTQLSFALGLPLSYLVSTATACKLLVSAAIASLVIGTARLARYVGASPWVALLVAPVALGWVTFIGFVAYLVGTAIWLLALPLVDRWTEAPSVRLGAATCGAVVLLHLAHLASSACTVLAIVVLTLARGIDRRTPLRLAPAALALALTVADMRADRAVAAAAALGWNERGTVWPPVRIKLTMLGDYLFGAVGAVPELLVGMLTVGALAAAIFSRRASGQRAASPDGRLVRGRFGWLAAALLLAYFVSPFAVGAGGYVDARFLPPAWMVGVVAVARAAPARLPSLARGIFACVPLAWLAVVWPAFADSDREQRWLADLYPHVKRASAVAVMAVGDEGGQPYLHASAGNRLLAERGGRVLYSLVEAPRAPVLIARRCRWDDAVSRLYGGGIEAMVPPFDATRFRYLLLRIPGDDLARETIRALAPDYRVEAVAGAWVLLESTHPTVPLDAPDATPPPGVATLAERIQSYVARPASTP